MKWNSNQNETGHYHHICLAGQVFWLDRLLERMDKETAEQFAERHKPDSSTLTYKVMETKWNAIPVLISFYKQAYKLPIKIDTQVSRRITKLTEPYISSWIKTITAKPLWEPSIPKAVIRLLILSFLRCWHNKTKELIVLVTWEQRHYDVNGILYEDLFDYELTKATLTWVLLEEISNKLDGGCECTWRDGTSER